MSIEYYEAQYAKSKKAMENKNTQLWKEWREDFDKREEFDTLLKEVKFLIDNINQEENK
jgi:hypothetical protein